MTWTETHRRWQALREIEALANASSAELPWNSEYAEIFGTPDDLVAALRYRWDLTRHAQLDTHLTEAAYDEQRRRLVARNAGVLALLRSYDAGRITIGDATQTFGVDSAEDERVPA